MLEIWTSEFIINERNYMVMDNYMNVKEMMEYSQIVRIVLKMVLASQKIAVTLRKQL